MALGRCLLPRRSPGERALLYIAGHRLWAAAISHAPPVRHNEKWGMKPRFCARHVVGLAHSVTAKGPLRPSGGSLLRANQRPEDLAP
jgi:hypothetical protein